MKVQSFRSIVTITLIIVISTISFIAFRMYSHSLEKKIYAESERNLNSTLAVLNLLKGQIYYSIDEHNGKIIETLMDKMHDASMLYNTWLFDAQGNLNHSLHKDSISASFFCDRSITSVNDGICVRSFQEEDPPFLRACFQMENTPACYECHAPEEQTLGYLVIDLAMDQTDSKIEYIGRSSLIFTIAMVLIIILTILFMHYKFVRTSLREFNLTMDAVNRGNLKERIAIPETKELGKLGRNFNEMLDTLYKAQKELEDFHKKELRSNYKLATIGEMSARLAHEIRNPVTGIANAMEVLVKESDDPETLPILEEIQRQANRVNNTVSSLLKYSQKIDLNLIVNNINEVMEQLVFFLKSHVNGKDIRFSLELQKGVPPFRFDHEQMENALLNLGLNSIREIHREGLISFSTVYKQEDNTVQIRVSDNGPGIPEEILPQIFHPFFTTHHEGTGLGLAIVKDIVEKHRGEIWAENNQDSGCTFTISLPVEN